VNGTLLHSLRIARGWTQEEAAAQADLSDRLIRKAEGGGPLQINSIARLAEIYSTPQRQLTPADLLDEDVSRSDPLPSRPSDAAARVRRFFAEVWGQSRIETIDELASPDCLLHAEGTIYRGRDALRQRALAVYAAFGRMEMNIQDLTVHGDVVICRWIASFTHSGPFWGIAPTNRRHTIRASTWIRFDDDWLHEGWDYFDQNLIETLTTE
jgi:predicted ester cyclase